MDHSPTLRVDPHEADQEPTPAATSAGTVLVLGASGYIGGRLIPELVRAGHSVRCMTRSADALRRVRWASETEIVEGDLLDPSSLAPAFEGIDTVVYLVHSLGDDGDFRDTERAAAEHARRAADDAGVSRFVYLSGLGDSTEELSDHLGSRHDVGRALAEGAAEVVELRAAIVLGAGSASFEMLRSLAEVLPVMVAPPWVTTTMVQPIAVGDVLTYVLSAIGAPSTDRHHRVIEIGGPERMTYRELIDVYTDVAGLPRRRIVQFGLIPLGLSANWVNLVTPLPKRLARRLIESLENDVVVTDDSARELSGHDTIPVDMAIEASIAAIEDLDVPTRWSGQTSRTRAAQPRPWDPDWAGGTVYEDRREVITDAEPDALMRTITGVGGERGWYGFGVLWHIRGLVDQLVGGVGLRRGRRHPDEIEVGEALDFWRVEVADDDLFRLRAEMRLPGVAWLEWSLEPGDGAGADGTASGRTRVVQRARFVPAGLFGRLYWSMVVPFHVAIFPIMLRRLVAATPSA